MAAEVKTEFKIPDLWFDFYARLIPGAAFIAAVRFWSVEIQSVPNTNEIIILFGLSYFSGIITQPVSSRIVKFIENRVNPKRKCKDEIERKWLRVLQYTIGRESRDSLILSKMHGEITLFAQLAVMTVLFWFQNQCELFPKLTYSNFNICWAWYPVIFILFIFAAFEVGNRRMKRAMEIDLFIKKGIIKSLEVDMNTQTSEATDNDGTT